MYKKCGFVFLIALLVTGCTSAINTLNKAAGLGVIKERTSDYDGTHTIMVTTNVVMNFSGIMDTSTARLGAIWSDDSPDYAALTIQVPSTIRGGGYVDVYQIDVMIDGVERVFKLGLSEFTGKYEPLSNNIYTDSKNLAAMELSYLRKMVMAEDVNIRVHSKKPEELDFDKEKHYGADTAKVSIAELLARVDEYLASKN